MVELCWQVGAGTLFPGRPAIRPPRAKPNKWFNSALNSRQRAAVVRILGAQCSHAPYVVFGPPGTGKTVTLVESVLQVSFVRYHRLCSVEDPEGRGHFFFDFYIYCTVDPVCMGTKT